MSITLFKGEISSAARLIEEFFSHFKVLEDTYSEWLMDIHLWNQIVLSKSAPGVYRMLHSINVPVFFPHAAKLQYPMECIALDKTHRLPTQTIDVTLPAWHHAKVEIRIDPPIWELHNDISLLEDPPAPCRVTIRVFDLLFKRFIEVEKERRKFDKTMTVFNEHIVSQADLQNFINAPGTQMKYLHRRRTKDLITQRIWHDLVGSRVTKNSFAMRLPFLLRMISDTDDRRLIPRGVCALAVGDDILRSAGFPENRSKDRCVGLYSANINLITMHPRTNVIPHTYSLWPDICPTLSDLTPPDCRVGLYLSDVRFVGIADERELREMAGRMGLWDGLCALVGLLMTK